jgi:hypothetical protein
MRLLEWLFWIVVIVTALTYVMKQCSVCSEQFSNPFNECIVRLTVPTAKTPADYRNNVTNVIIQYASRQNYTSNQRSTSLLKPSCMF